MRLMVRVGDLYRGQYGGLFLVTAITSESVSPPGQGSVYVPEAGWHDVADMARLYWVNWMVYDAEFSGADEIWEDDGDLESVFNSIIDGRWVAA